MGPAIVFAFPTSLIQYVRLILNHCIYVFILIRQVSRFSVVVYICGEMIRNIMLNTSIYTHTLLGLRFNDFNSMLVLFIKVGRFL